MVLPGWAAICDFLEKWLDKLKVEPDLYTEKSGQSSPGVFCLDEFVRLPCVRMCRYKSIT
jgi:hypothetical protein